MIRHSTSEYTPDWPEIAKRVKDAAGWKCIRCGHLHEPEMGYGMTVHHLDLSPANNAWWNTAALCQRCHLHIQNKVVMERVWMLDHTDWFKPYAAGFYAHLFGLSEEREWVIENQDRLILLGQHRIKMDAFSEAE